MDICNEAVTLVQFFRYTLLSEVMLEKRYVETREIFPLKSVSYRPTGRQRRQRVCVLREATAVRKWHQEGRKEDEKRVSEKRVDDDDFGGREGARKGRERERERGFGFPLDVSILGQWGSLTSQSPPPPPLRSCLLGAASRSHCSLFSSCLSPLSPRRPRVNCPF